MRKSLIALFAVALFVPAAAMAQHHGPKPTKPTQKPGYNTPGHSNKPGYNNPGYNTPVTGTPAISAILAMVIRAMVILVISGTPVMVTRGTATRAHLSAKS